MVRGKILFAHFVRVKESRYFLILRSYIHGREKKGTIHR